MSFTVEVIVNKYDADSECVYNIPFFRKEFSSIDAAMTVGESEKSFGISVIVRPNYNEADDKGPFFREWRSINGEPFKECLWRFGGSREL